MNHAHEFERLTTANRLSSVFRVAATAALSATVLASAACAHPHADQDQADCGVVGTWIDPATAETIAPNQLLAGLAQRPVVLLGESHDNAEHHRWQLHTLAALHGHNPDMILGFESFPRRVQPVLDQWVNGELDPIAFLEAADWANVWNFDPTLYLPLFDFARQNRIPMIALNVDRDFVVRVRREGWSAIPADERLGLSDPASAAPAYREFLAEVYAYEQLHTAKHVAQGDPHQADTEGEAAVDDADAVAGEGESPADEIDAPTDEGDGAAGEVHAPTDEAKAAGTDSDASASATEAEADVPEVEVDIESILESEDFAQFVSAQQTWDRAMAEAIAEARQRQPSSLVVGILGRGHLEYGYGVPHQLADLGIPDAAVLLPIERETTCDGLPVDLAETIFVIEPTASIVIARPKPLLGVMLAQTDDGVQIKGVMEGSIAEAIALQKGDIVIEAAGFPIAKLAELIEVVQRQAPG
ncbi:MAG: ChaN family lipoprotein, partial [Deltaproteobacteria bacterium]|nr:ChaN family lipoprotein [Deltaproteobacteria bacterium]